MEPQLVVSPAPHLRAPDNIKKIMWSVVVALLPAVGISLYFFGLDALRVYAISIAAAELTELACLRVRGKSLSRAGDGSALVTGILLGLSLPPGFPTGTRAISSTSPKCPTPSRLATTGSTTT